MLSDGLSKAVYVEECVYGKYGEKYQRRYGQPYDDASCDELSAYYQDIYNALNVYRFGKGLEEVIHGKSRHGIDAAE